MSKDNLPLLRRSRLQLVLEGVERVGDGGELGVEGVQQRGALLQRQHRAVQLALQVRLVHRQRLRLRRAARGTRALPSMSWGDGHPPRCAATSQVDSDQCGAITRSRSPAWQRSASAPAFPSEGPERCRLDPACDDAAASDCAARAGRWKAVAAPRPRRRGGGPRR